MAKRTYIGDPIDATMQYIKERKHKGETVAGSSDDDLGEEMTDAIPSFVERDVYTERQLEMIQNKILYPDLDIKELAERFDYNYTTLSSFLSGFRDRYDDELKDADLFEKLLPPAKKGAVKNGDSSPETEAKVNRERDRVREYWVANPTANVETVRADTQVSELSDQAISSIKGSLVQSGEIESVTPAPGDNTPDPEQTMPPEAARVLMDEIKELRTEVEELKQLRANSPVDASDDPTVGELDADTLFAIVSGDDLTPEQRREVFEVVVS